ncbi:hypothetical protein SAMN05216406_12017 [Nitrosomonas ureae]|uniref:Transposase n=2 Tax=Nitrosomonas ureae TaxID=44577 RepID=A0A1H2FDN1_9PROT|nr:hypothetical protein C8R27_11062 [Nitrosomonas ureae]SDU05068.1 hypothetical protein SAMN05216406_12017 [Nitrosomonas ureae]
MLRKQQGIFVAQPAVIIQSKERFASELEDHRGEDKIAELCRRESINTNIHYRWPKEFLEAMKMW